MKSRENPLELMVFNRLNVCVFLSVKYCQSIVGGKVLGGENQTPVRHTGNNKTHCISAGFILNYRSDL